MRIGNMPKQGAIGVAGKVYWSLAIGPNAVPYRMFDGGWRAFEFVVFKPLAEYRKTGEVLPYIIRLAFAYWLPFMPL